MNGISKSASCDNIATRRGSSGKGRKSRDAGQKPEAEVLSKESDKELEDESYRRGSDTQDDVFVVELEKGDSGIGVGLIDGLVSFECVNTHHS